MADTLSPFRVERIVPPARRFPAHSHDEFVISVNGASALREQIRLDRRRFDVGTDEITVYNPGEVQSSWTVTREDAEWECFSIYLDPEIVTTLTGVPDFEVHRPVVADRRLAEALRRVGRLSDTQAAGETAVWVASEALHQARGAAGLRQELESRVGRIDLQSVLERMRRDLRVPVGIAELARSVSLSQDHFIRSFVRLMGLPPYAWHLQLRLREGRRRLRAGDTPAQVAAELGFSDQAHFHRHFRAAYAQTPGYVHRQPR